MFSILATDSQALNQIFRLLMQNLLIAIVKSSCGLPYAQSRSPNNVSRDVYKETAKSFVAHAKSQFAQRKSNR